MWAKGHRGSGGVTQLGRMGTCQTPGVLTRARILGRAALVPGSRGRCTQNSSTLVWKRGQRSPCAGAVLPQGLGSREGLDRSLSSEQVRGGPEVLSLHCPASLLVILVNPWTFQAGLEVVPHPCCGTPFMFAACQGLSHQGPSSADGATPSALFLHPGHLGDGAPCALRTRPSQV